jgi:hypothetical protein
LLSSRPLASRANRYHVRSGHRLTPCVAREYVHMAIAPSPPGIEGNDGAYAAQPWSPGSIVEIQRLVASLLDRTDLTSS